MVALLAPVPNQTKELCRFADRSQLNRNPRHMVDRAFRLGNQGEACGYERPINELLKPVIDRYLAQHRLVPARLHRASSALWLSSRGAPITAQQLTAVITKTTLSAVGVAVSPHRFARLPHLRSPPTVATIPISAARLCHHIIEGRHITDYNLSRTIFSAGREFSRNCSADKEDSIYHSILVPDVRLRVRSRHSHRNTSCPLYPEADMCSAASDVR